MNQVSYSCYLSQLEPKKIIEALEDESWVTAPHEELHQFIRNDVWTLVPRPKEKNVIGTKWIFKNKYDAHGTVMHNKARLIAQGYTQVEGVDFDETFALVARLESIRILLSISSHLKIKLYQMDVKSAFSNGILRKKSMSSNLKVFRIISFLTMFTNSRRLFMALSKPHGHGMNDSQHIFWIKVSFEDKLTGLYSSATRVSKS